MIFGHVTHWQTVYSALVAAHAHTTPFLTTSAPYSSALTFGGVLWN